MKKTIQSFLLLFILSIGACAPAPTPLATMQVATEVAPVSTMEPTIDNTHYTIAEVEKLAGFDVREPAYLSAGVSFEYATFQAPYVILHFKLVHETYGDMGAFFQIMQEMQPEAPPDVVACGEGAQGCEVLQIHDTPVVYHLNPAGPEGLDWHKDGMTYRLLRMAGEPNKVYKEELIKVVESME